MVEPSEKSPEIESFLEGLSGGRVKAIRESKCIPPPIGCGGKAMMFRDHESMAEYKISGLCQKCQDEVFGI